MFTKFAILPIILFSLFQCGENKLNPNKKYIPLLQLTNSFQTNSQINSLNNCPSSQLPTGIWIADTVTEAPGSNSSIEFKNPNKAINGICGMGDSIGSFDVYELGSTIQTGYIILEWKDKKVKNVSGVDFVVFENSFKYNNGSYFLEPVIVEVSNDKSKWCGWNPDYRFSTETTYSSTISDWTNFAGLTPVKYNMTTNPLSVTDIFNSAKAGGDGFDLDNLSTNNNSASGSNCTTTEANDIKANGFTYLRLTNAFIKTNPDTNQNFPQDLAAVGRGPDIDGVIAKELISR